MKVTTRHQQEEQGYLASVSDLMSGLMFIFIITLVVFALALLDREKQQQEEVERLTGARAEMQNLLSDIEVRLKQRGIEVRIVPDQGVLRLGERLLFASGSARLEDQGHQTVRVLAAILTDVLPCYTGEANRMTSEQCAEKGNRGRVEALFIEGHTDDRMPRFTTGFTDNWDLSVARAKTIYQGLTQESFGLDQLVNDDRQPILSLSGYAERRAVAPNDTEEMRAFNRRIDLRFVMTPPRDALPEPARRTQEALPR